MARDSSSSTHEAQQPAPAQAPAGPRPGSEAACAPVANNERDAEGQAAADDEMMLDIDHMTFEAADAYEDFVTREQPCSRAEMDVSADAAATCTGAMGEAVAASAHNQAGNTAADQADTALRLSYAGASSAARHEQGSAGIHTGAEGQNGVEADNCTWQDTTLTRRGYKQEHRSRHLQQVFVRGDSVVFLSPVDHSDQMRIDPARHSPPAARV